MEHYRVAADTKVLSKWDRPALAGKSPLHLKTGFRTSHLNPIKLCYTSKRTAVNGVAAFANEDFQALARSISDKSCQASPASLCNVPRPSASSLGQRCQTRAPPWQAGSTAKAGYIVWFLCMSRTQAARCNARAGQRVLPV